MKYPEAFLQFCAKLSLTLTSLRREVLFILWQAKKPVKAYELLAELVKTNSQSKPPSIYRALNYFADKGIVHKIESIQSYTLCCEPQKQLVSEVLMVCDTCHHVIEIHDPDLQHLVSKLSKENFFSLHDDIIELKGLCANCTSIHYTA
jgi:Fur family transcriptional regulator, zinc uptake regulator